MKGFNGTFKFTKQPVLFREDGTKLTNNGAMNQLKPGRMYYCSPSGAHPDCYEILWEDNARAVHYKILQRLWTKGYVRILSKRRG